MFTQKRFLIGLTLMFILMVSNLAVSAQERVGIAVTVNCNSITVQVTSNVPNTTTANIDVLDSAQSGSLLTGPASFTIPPGGVQQGTFQFREQPAGILVRYRVTVSDSTGQVGLATDEASCISFQPIVNNAPQATATPSVSQQPQSFGQVTFVPVYIQPSTTSYQPITIVPSSGSCTLQAGFRFVHVVRSGQNLFRIGLFYGIPHQTIANLNGIANVNRIYVGQCLQIP
jgi:hypothetical protein